MEELTVVKLGGSLLDDATSRGKVLAAIARRVRRGHPLVIVHGGGKGIDRAQQRLGIPKRTAGGLRVTDAQTLEVVVSVLGGTVNKTLISELAALGVAACGISGADGSTLIARKHPPVDGVDLGFVGTIQMSDPSAVRALLAAGLVPVVAALARGADGALYNVNADTAAAALAKALGAGRLVFLTDVEGLLDPRGHVVSALDANAAAALLDSGAVGGGMRPKLQACIEAIAAGTHHVVIAGPKKHAEALRGGNGGTHLVAA